MSKKHFHSHAPHDHYTQAAHVHVSDSLAIKIAVTTAIFTFFGAYFSFQDGETQNDLLVLKSEIAVSQTKATNQWNYYQAKSSKQQLAKFASQMQNSGARDFYLAEVSRYEEEKKEIKAQAEAYEKQVEVDEKKSLEVLAEHRRWAEALTLMQASIAIAAIAVLTRQRLMEFLSYGMGIVGIAFGISAHLM